MNRLIYQLLLLQARSENFWNFDLTTTKKCVLTNVNENALTNFHMIFLLTHYLFHYLFFYSLFFPCCHVLPFVFQFILWLLKNFKFVDTCYMLVWLFMHIPSFLVLLAFSMWYRFLTFWFNNQLHSIFKHSYGNSTHDMFLTIPAHTWNWVTVEKSTVPLPYIAPK